jgi:hypothetical protein
VFCLPGIDLFGLFWYDGESFCRLLSHFSSRKESLRIKKFQILVSDAGRNAWRLSLGRK